MSVASESDRGSIPLLSYTREDESESDDGDVVMADGGGEEGNEDESGDEMADEERHLSVGARALWPRV